jgi:sarcosine oxidase subunit delta
MLLITCPWCGPRDEDEFTNGGDAHLDRPEPPEVVSEEEWSAYLFLHANPKGVLAERWVHSFGCRRWFHALRDTANHRILATYRVDEPRSEISA